MEQRYQEIAIRAAGDMKIQGVASVWYDSRNSGTEYNLFGNVVERISPEAFDQVLKSKQDVLALFNHDVNHVLGRMSNDTLRIWKDERGLNYEVQLDPNQQSHRDLYASIQRGDIKGSSFGAMVGYTQWSKEGDKEVRTIKRFTALRDVSCVAIPAYSGTSTAIRSSEIKEIEAERAAFYAAEQTNLRLEYLKNLSK